MNNENFRFSIVKIEDSNNIDNINGVWALYGIKKAEKSKWTCLQVGQSNKIGDEIRLDISYLGKNNLQILKKNYINQFGEKMFEYMKYPSSREQLYKHLSEKYQDFIFVIIKCNRGNLKEIEKYYAWTSHAEYWRNGGTYIKEVNYTYEKFENIKNKIMTNKSLEEEIRRLVSTIDTHLNKSL